MSKMLSGLITAVLASALVSGSAIAKEPTVQIGSNKVKVEVASTPAQITRGLMYRTSMPEDHGMIFLFRPATGVKFWMAHCFISLDMLMIKDGKIVKIFENVPPCRAKEETDCPTYPGRDEAEIEVSEVLEVNGGYAKRHKIKEGDSIKFALGAAVPAGMMKSAKPPKAETK